MFANPIRPDPTIDEGTIMQVDPIRCFCKVRTSTGQILHSVQWLLPTGGSTRGADRFTPLVGDRVMINTGLGYPVIVGFFPRIQIGVGSTPIIIDNGDTLLDTGNYSPDGSATRGDQNKPKDMVQGDRIISTVSGNFLALLRGGAIALRASRAAEIFMSKFYNLVRIVSRNWEHFTDLSSDVIHNFKGRVYRYTGYAPTFLQSKVEDYRLHFYYGDTIAAEAVKTDYNGTHTPAAANTIIYKEQITDVPTTTPREIMRRTLNQVGEEEIWIYNGTHFVRIKSTSELISLSWNDQNTVTITEASIHLVHKDGADVTMDNAGIRADYGNSHVNMTDTSIISSNGGGSATVSDSLTQILNGSHSVSVSSSGVAIV